MPDQLALFGTAPDWPDGFRYADDIITPHMERQLLATIEQLPFREFEFHGYVGKRRTVSFGWRYDFAERRLHQAGELPAFLAGLREAAAAFAGMSPVQLQQALVTEYRAGAAIGWHRDKAVFGEVVGISLLAPCTFRLRRQRGTAWERMNLTALPRSAYLLSGPARTEWEHSIPPVDALRYSVTFRNLRASARA